MKISHFGKFRILGKNVFLIAFRQVLTKILPAAFIQWHNYQLFKKTWLNLSPLIQISVLQDYIPGSYTRYLLPYQKCQKLLHPSSVDPLLVNLYGKPWWCGESGPTAKNLLISLIRKIPLNLNLSLSKVSFLLHQIAISR